MKLDIWIQIHKLMKEYVISTGQQPKKIWLSERCLEDNELPTLGGKLLKINGLMVIKKQPTTSMAVTSPYIIVYR